MAEIIRNLGKGYLYYFHEITDHRTRDWLLVAKPIQVSLLLWVYLKLVYKWGPRWMMNRPAFNLDKVLIAYNLIQVVLCVKLLLNSFSYWGWGGSFKWICEPIDFSNAESAVTVAKLVHDYYLIKIFDLLDTIFFILRKKFNQVTFLHVYHHAGMVLLIWAAVSYFPGGHGTSLGVINSFVHSVMYTYYLLTITTPSVKNIMWLKKLVTQLQITQFLLLILHIGSIVFIPDCEYPRWIAAVFLPQNLFMLILFLDFYIKTYINKSANVKVETDNSDNKIEDRINNKSVNEQFSDRRVSKNENDNNKVEYIMRNHENISCITSRNLNRT